LSVGGSPWDGRFYADMAHALERACFDYIMIEDTLMVSEAYGGTAEAALKHALQVPKHDPSPLAAIISAATRRLGVVATFSTMAYPPWMLARLCCTLDHIAGGRFGWNIVTSGEDAAAQNFGMDQLPPREQRYAMADEYVDVVCQLCSIRGIRTQWWRIATPAPTPITARCGRSISRGGSSRCAGRLTR
jgi:long-chain alkane monooxygenase